MTRVYRDSISAMAGTRAPFGSWRSPIDSALVASEALRFSEVLLDGEELYWLERRPHEEGRSVVVCRRDDGRIEDCIPREMNARTLVHEYGGGSYTVHGGELFFVNFDDQRLYRSSLEAAPRALTAPSALRFADFHLDAERSRLLSVVEDHTGEGADEPKNYVGSVSLDDGGVESLVEGDDFYSDPILSPDGRRLAWLSWSHPNMPWDGTLLRVADLAADGRPREPRVVAGSASESVFQPRWSPAGELFFVSDRSGWWNLYRSSDNGVRPVFEGAVEVGLPLWVFGMSTYAFADNDTVVLTYCDAGLWRWAEIRDGTVRRRTTTFTDIQYLQAGGGRTAFVGANSVEAPSVVTASVASDDVEIVRSSSRAEIDTGYLSSPSPVEFSIASGGAGHAFFYAPQNKDYEGPAGELPMLLVLSHGGPTAAASSSRNLGIQYWTSRGFAVVDVNYRGSTGYGRAYRQALDGEWGIADVEDCASVARALVEAGKVDGDRLAIRGGSAGGYTTLAALAFTETFCAGASYYGIGDLESLARDTHKFESRYLDRLVGPYPESRELYLQRSPVQVPHRLSCPVIFLQGLEDKVVPPSQAEAMVAALRDRGVAVAYLPFAGEQHGFRRSENIRRAMEAELYFYSRVFAFAVSEDLPEIEIFNSETLPG